MASKKLTSIKMSATWEFDRSAPNVVLRVCRMTLTSLEIYTDAENEANTTPGSTSSIFIALKMRGHSKRVLRSPEIDLAAGSSEDGARKVDVHLDLSYQYGHVIKGDDNILYIMLQRRKKYKNKPMLGYKTLALCEINMAQVLQRRFEDQTFELYSTGKIQRPLARVFIRSLSSVPTEMAPLSTPGRSAAVVAPGDKLSKKGGSAVVPEDGLDDPLDFVDLEADWERAEDSDLGEEISPAEEVRSRQQKKFLRAIGVQKNLKRKFIGLIRKFKMTEDDEVADDVEEEEEEEEGEFARIMEEIERLGSASDADSDLEVDDMSLQSTPRPRLRPFFAHQRVTSASEDTLFRKSPVPPAATAAPAVAEQDSSEENSNDSGGPGTGSGGPCGETRRRLGGSGGGKLPRMKRLTSGKSREGSSGPAGVVLREKRTVSNLTAISGPGGPSVAAGQKEKEKEKKKEEEKDAGGQKEQRKSRYSVALAASELAPSVDVMEAVGRWLMTDSAAVINTYVLVQKGYHCSKAVVEAFSQSGTPALPVANYVDMKYAMTNIMNKLQNQNRSTGAQVRLGALGGDSLLNLLLRCFVELLSSRSPDWLSALRIFPVPMPPPASQTSSGGAANTNTSAVSPPPPPLGGPPPGQVPYVICKALAAHDERYASLFGEGARWRADLCEAAEVAQRMATYMSQASRVLQLPVSECLLVNRSKTSSDEEVSEQYIPFLGGIQLGDADRLPASWFSFSAEEEPPVTAGVPGTPDRPTPPNSPHPAPGAPRTSQNACGPPGLPPGPSASGGPSIGPGVAASQPIPVPGAISGGGGGGSGTGGSGGVMGGCGAGSGGPGGPSAAIQGGDSNTSNGATSPPSGSGSMAFHPSEAVDIQIDYWLDGVERKYSIKKSSTRCVQITSNGLLSEGSNPLLSMTVASMEKKQKIMRIGKKQKEVEIRRDVIENISRLVGTSKSQSNSMKVIIDGIGWPCVKFFQLSPSWHTHVKWFPVAVFQESSRPYSNTV